MKNTFTKGEQSAGYKLLSVLALMILAFFFIFPLYWIITGSFKDALTINLPKPQWFPLAPTTQNYINLFKQPAFQWLLNTIIISVGAIFSPVLLPPYRLCACQKAFLWTNHSFHAVCLCNGTAKTGHCHSAASGDECTAP